MSTLAEHRQKAEALRARVGEAPGESDAALRKAALARAAGGTPLAAPYEAMVARIAAAPYRVTDAEVAAVRAASGSDKATFEIVMAAAIGAGLMRFDAAMRAIEEAGDAA